MNVHIHEQLEEFQQIIEGFRHDPPRCCPPEQSMMMPRIRLAHLLWMIEEARAKYLQTQSAQEVLEAIGFIKGAMWQEGLLSWKDAELSK